MTRMLTAAVLATFTTPLSAAEAPVPEPGGRVRVWMVPTSDVLYYEGTLVEVDGAGVVVETGRARTRRVVPRDEIARLQLATGRTSRGERALIGLAIGVTAGAALGFAAGDDPPSAFIGFKAEEKALALGILGASVGSVFGATIPRDHNWTTVRIPGVSGGRVGLVLPRGGAGIAVAMGF